MLLFVKQESCFIFTFFENNSAIAINDVTLIYKLLISTPFPCKDKFKSFKYEKISTEKKNY